MSDLLLNGNIKHRIIQYLRDKAMAHFGKLDGLTFVVSAKNKCQEQILITMKKQILCWYGTQ